MCIVCIRKRVAENPCSLVKPLKILGSGVCRVAFLDEENNLVHKITDKAENNETEIEAVILWNKKQEELKNKGEWPKWLHTPTDAHTCYDCTDCDQGTHMVMPYVKGKTLHTIMLELQSADPNETDYWVSLSKHIPDVNERFDIIYALGFYDPHAGNIVVDDETGDWTIIDLGENV